MKISSSLLLVAVVLSACGRHEPAGDKKNTGPVPVTVATVEQRVIPRTLAAVGNVEALASVTLKSRVDGQIVEVLVKDGQQVTRDQLLMRIDPRPFALQLTQAQANLARDRALLDTATAQEVRYKELLAQHYVSPDQYAQIKGSRDNATAALLTDQSTIGSAKLQLEFASIRAPIAGKLGRIALARGNLVKANDSVLTTLNQVDPIYLSFAVPERELAAIRAAMAQHTLAVQARPQSVDTALTGTLSFIDNAVDAATGTIRLRATFANANGLLWPGQYAEVALNLGEEQALTLPLAAVQNGPSGVFAFVVLPDNTVALRELTVARSTAQFALVAKGVTAGERVVIDGQSRLTPGAAVVVQAPAN